MIVINGINLHDKMISETLKKTMLFCVSDDIIDIAYRFYMIISLPWEKCELTYTCVCPSVTVVLSRFRNR